MKEALEEAIKVNANKASGSVLDGTEAMKFTQACVNAANALVVLAEAKRMRKEYGDTQTG